MSGGLVVMALTATAIMSNAMLLQKSRHPEPLFNTRPAAVASRQSATPAPIVRPQAPAPAAQVAPAAMPKVAPPVPLRKPAPAVAPVAPAASAASLIPAIQRELARLGIYAGPIDGLSGARTRAAIANYQAAASLPVTGDVSTELLASLKQASLQVATPPAPAPSVAAAKPDQVAAAVKRAAELQREEAALKQGDRLRRIQSALDQIGYGPLAVDGQPSAATADAIRRFELDNGLPVTGEPGDKVIARLTAIGALKAN